MPWTRTIKLLSTRKYRGTSATVLETHWGSWKRHACRVAIATMATIFEPECRVPDNNSSKICHVRPSSRVVTDVEQPCEHLKRLRTPMKNETRLHPKSKQVSGHCCATTAKPAPPLGVTSHRATMDATPQLTKAEATLYRSCVGALMHYVLDRADTQLEDSILGSCLRAPTTGSMEALRIATRYLLRTRDT